MKNAAFLFKKLILLLFISISLVSCETEDILPAVELSVDNANLGENLQSVVLTATLNSNAIETITIRAWKCTGRCSKK